MLIIMMFVISIITLSPNNIYSDEDGFKEYIEGQCQTSPTFTNKNDSAISYEYNDNISFAIRNYSCDYDFIVSFRDDELKKIKQREIEKYDSLVNETDDPNNGKWAVLLTSYTYLSDNGVINLAIHVKEDVQNENQMVESYTEVFTYQFSKKTSDPLVPQQIFEDGYKDKCAVYFTNYFMNEYSKKELKDGWEKYVQASEENYNKFILTDNGVLFFFNLGTILDESEGLISAGIYETESDELLRDKIIQRYIVPDRPMVALTYDDGPGEESEDRILTCLEANNAVATFFYQGYRIKNNEQKIQKAKEIGCEIGNHSWNHPVLTELKSSELQKQLKKTNDAIYAACGSYPTVFRPCYGETNGKVNKMSNMPVIMWSIDTLDWKYRNGKKVFNTVAKKKNLDGSIILLHSIHNSTADATELLVPWLKSHGYQLVTVSELIKYKSGIEPVPGKVYRTQQ